MENNQWYWKRTQDENGKSFYLAVNVCMRCEKEYNNGNVAASKYCPECAKIVQAEQNRERVKRCRERKKKSVKNEEK